MKGEDVENLLRARGEFRPHPEFGVNLHVPWSAGTQASQPLASGWSPTSPSSRCTLVLRKPSASVEYARLWDTR